MRRSVTAVLGLALAFSLSAGIAAAADWPQWRGPDRTGLSKETGLRKTWPKEGPPLAWKASGLGAGFGTPVVAGGTIYGLGTRDRKDGIWALGEKDGKELWFTPIDDQRNPNQNNGASGSPTVHDGKLYAVSSKGKAVCLDAATGKAVWTVDLVKELGGSVPGWGYTESPLVDGDKVIVTPGRKNTIVALNKATGDTVWKAAVPGADGAGYSSVVAAEIAGQKQYVQFVGKGVVSVGASDGAFLWRYDAPANGTANCSTPIVHDGHVFAASNYGNGGGLAKVTKSGDKFEAKEVYFTKKMQNHHGGMVLVDGYLYGDGGGQFRCIELTTGKVMWEEGTGKGSVTYADGMLYFREEGGKGRIRLVEADPKKYSEAGRFDQPERTKLSAWAHPVVANGKLYVRDQDLLLCFNVNGDKN